MAQFNMLHTMNVEIICMPDLVKVCSSVLEKKVFEALTVPPISTFMKLEAQPEIARILVFLGNIPRILDDGHHKLCISMERIVFPLTC